MKRTFTKSDRVVARRSEVVEGGSASVTMIDHYVIFSSGTESIQPKQTLGFRVTPAYARGTRLNNFQIIEELTSSIPSR